MDIEFKPIYELFDFCRNEWIPTGLSFQSRKEALDAMAEHIEHAKVYGGRSTLFKVIEVTRKEILNQT